MQVICCSFRKVDSNPFSLQPTSFGIVSVFILKCSQNHVVNAGSVKESTIVNINFEYGNLRRPAPYKQSSLMKGVNIRKYSLPDSQVILGSIQCVLFKTDLLYFSQTPGAGMSLSRSPLRCRSYSHFKIRCL